jgi:DNA-binding NtrC family response regulator
VTLPRLKKRLTELESARELRRVEWTNALETTRGNITRAAKLLAISRQRATILMKEFNLKEFARELRKKAGVKATGRPRGR